MPLKKGCTKLFIFLGMRGVGRWKSFIKKKKKEKKKKKRNCYVWATAVQ